jgi:ferredoxin
MPPSKCSSRAGLLLWGVLISFLHACACCKHTCIDIFVYVYVHGCVSTCNSHVDSEHPNKQCAHLTRAFASCPAGCWCEQVPIFLGKRRDICMMVRFLALHVVWVCVGVAGAGVASVRADDPISRPANPKNLTVISLRPVNLSSTLVNKNSADAAGGELCARSMPCN